jgi:hypothetical protein
MPYVSPIPLLSEAQRAQFPDIDLKKIRNEVLLHFQFSAEPVVEIQGQYYDKDEVVSLLDLLQANPGLHWTIFQLPAVRELLEVEDLQKFNQVKALNAIDQYPEYAEAIHDLLVQVINQRLPDQILDFTWETTSLLGTIQYYTSRRTEEQQAVAYSNTFSTFKLFTESLEVKYPDPFVAPGNFTFKPELAPILQREVLNFFKYLPPAFGTCLTELGTWCNNHVVVAFVREQDEIMSWPKESIRLVIEAAAIAAETFNREGNTKIIYQLQGFLDSTPQRTSNPWRVILMVIMGFIFLFRVGSICSRQQDRRDNRRYSAGREVQISNERVRDVLEAQGFQFDDRGNMTKVNEAGLKELRILNGSELMPDQLPVFKSKVWNQQDSILTIEFETEVLPKGRDGLNSLIRPEMLSTIAGKKAYIDLKFLRKNIKGVTFTHRFLHESDGNLKIIKGRISDLTPSGKITIVPLKDLKRYKGLVTMMDLNGKILDRDTLGLVTMAKTGYQQVVYNGYVDGTVSAQDSTRLHIRGVRSSCLMGIMKAVEHITIQNAMEEKLNDISTYGFSNEAPLAPDALNHSFLTSTKSTNRALIYTYTSGADHIAYCELDGGEYNIRYMINTKTGEIAGCQLVQISEDRQYVEKLEMFLTN